MKPVDVLKYGKTETDSETTSTFSKWFAVRGTTAENERKRR